MIVPAEAQW